MAFLVAGTNLVADTLREGGQMRSFTVGASLRFVLSNLIFDKAVRIFGVLTELV